MSKTQLFIKVQLGEFFTFTSYISCFIFYTRIDALNKRLCGSGITPTNNEIKDIMKVIKSLENREIVLKGTTRKKIDQDERFLNSLGPLMRTGLSLIKNILTPWANCVLVLLGSTAATSAVDPAIKNTFFWFGMATLIILNIDTDDVMKIVISLKESHLLVKRSKETIKNKAQEQKGGFLPMLLGTLASSLLPRKATFLSRRAKGKTKNKRGRQNYSSKWWSY